MTDIGARSLQEIKGDTEQTRTQLTDTVEQLRSSVTETATDIRDRLKPEAIKNEVSDYLKSRGEQLWEDVNAAARKNPMQAVAVGASIAYPLLRVARAIPLPLWMIGAGWFFAGSKTGQSITRQTSEAASDLAAELSRRGQQAQDQISETVTSAQHFASEQFHRAKTALTNNTDDLKHAAMSVNGEWKDVSEEVRQSVVSVGGAINDKAADLASQTMGAVSSAASKVQQVAGDVTAATTLAAKDAANKSSEMLGAAQTRASELGDRATRTFYQTVEENPLLVAGVGLVIGGLIASALPRTAIEDDVIGDASNSVRKQAADVASRSMASAKDAVADVYANVSSHADKESLTPTGLNDAFKDLGQRVRRVAEAGVTTAFAPDDEIQKSVGGKNHG